MSTIFVQIAAYRDPQLKATLKDMLDKAKNPQEISVGIAWQHGPDDVWDDQTESLSDHVAAWTGNDCRILTFTQAHVEERGAHEPVLVDAAHEGVAFHGDMQGLASAVKSDTIGRRRARSKAT